MSAGGRLRWGMGERMRDLKEAMGSFLGRKSMHSGVLS